MAPLLLAGCRPDAPTSTLFSHAEIIGMRGTGLGQFTKPRSLALDRDDNLYVVDMTGRVQKFSPRGELVLSWRMPESDLGKPKGMCRDAKGNIVIVEPHYQRLNHFAPDGTLIEQWGSRGTNLGQLVLPRAVAVSSRGDIFVSEYATVDRVQGYSADGRRPIVMFGQPGTGDGEFNRAEGLDVDAQDRIYVADSCNHRIQIFSRDGKWLKTYGKAGRGLGELSYPYDVRVDSAGRQYVCEFGNSRIQAFDTNNEPLEIIGGPGARPGQFNNPWAIALDSHGNLFVADAGNHRVQKFMRRATGWSAVEERPPSPPFLFGGVRPSSGAAGSGWPSASNQSCAHCVSCISAPGDGRTPPNTYSPPREGARRWLPRSWSRLPRLSAYGTRLDVFDLSRGMAALLLLGLRAKPRRETKASPAGVRVDQSTFTHHAPRITGR